MLIFSILNHPCSFMVYYCIASSLHGQNEPNRALWLATRAGKMELSCLLGITRRVPGEKNIPESHIINPSLANLVRLRWLDFSLVIFLQVYGPRLYLGPQTSKKRSLANIQPSWSHAKRSERDLNPRLPESPAPYLKATSYWLIHYNLPLGSLNSK